MQIVTSLTVDHGPTQKSGFLRMTHAACSAQVTDDGTVVGELRGCLGGGVQVEDKETGYTWHLDYKDLWQAVQQAKHPFLAGFEHIDGDIAIQASLISQAFVIACEEANCPLSEEQQAVIAPLFRVITENFRATLLQTSER